MANSIFSSSSASSKLDIMMLHMCIESFLDDSNSDSCHLFFFYIKKDSNEDQFSLELERQFKLIHQSNKDEGLRLNHLGLYYRNHSAMAY